MQNWKAYVKYLVFIMILLFPSMGFSGTLVHIESDNVTGNVKSSIKASRHVVIRFDNVTIRGNSGFYDRSKGILRVNGNVRIREGEAFLKCSKIVYNLRSKRAVLLDVVGRLSPTDFIKAKRIDRVSEKEWVAYNGIYSPCKHKKPDWAVGARKFKILVGKSFIGKWVTFRIKEIPIFPIPFLNGPIAKERRSGLLVPHIGYRKKDGFTYKQPFYIVLGRSKDLTLTYQRRFKSGSERKANFRYVFSRNNKGEASYDLVDTNYAHSWEFSLWHIYNPSGSSYGNLNIDLVKNRNYFKDSDTFNVEKETQRYTRSDVTYSRLSRHFVFNANLEYLNDLNGSTNRVYQKLPEISAYLMDTPIPYIPITFSFDSDLTYFYRKAGGSGYRFMAQPSFRYERDLGIIKNSSKVSYLISDYQNNSTQNMLELKNVSTSNLYYSLNGFSLSVNPCLTFKIAQGTSGKPIYDNKDILNDQKSVSPSIVSYIYNNGKNLARLSFKGFYDVHNDNWGLWRANIDTSLRNIDLSESAFYSPDDNQLKKLNTYLTARILMANLWLNHYYDFDKTSRSNYLRWGLSFPIGKFLEFSYDQRYDMRLSEDRERNYTFHVNRGCWTADLSYRWVKNFDQSVNYQVLLQINLLRFGSYGYKFESQTR